MKIISKMLFVGATFLVIMGLGAVDFDGAKNTLSSSMPKLFYDFTTYNDNGTLKDLSGNGHDGHLSGSFTRVECDGQSGLFFNGKDTKIVPKDAVGLKVTGRLSIYIKVRIMPEWGKQMEAFSPLVFGSVDELGAQRNYSLFFDHGNQFSFDIGNGGSAYQRLGARILRRQVRKTTGRRQCLARQEHRSAGSPAGELVCRLLHGRTL